MVIIKLSNNLTPDEKERLKKIDDFFNKFEEDTRSRNSNAEDFLTKLKALEEKEKADKAELDIRRKTRMDRLNERKNINTKQEVASALTTKKKPSNNKKNKKTKLNTNIFKKVVLSMFALGCIMMLALGVFVLKVIADSPDIEYNNIYSLLNENSVLYDDKGEVMDSLRAFNKEGTRTNVDYKDLPKNLIDSFVSIEDKTFWKHHGFNVVRIFGAIKESFTTGRIGGTSTITQQLARNLYLSDDARTKRTLTRKIREAYYTVLLERHLEKEEILEAYLNTIYFGCDSFGIQAAARTYFDKDVSELDLMECAALASLPKAPNTYAWIKRIQPEDVTEPNSDNILLKTPDFYYIYNDTATPRRETCLALMKEQELISDAEYEEAKNEDFKAHLKPKANISSEVSSYFADYVVNQAVDALVNEAGMSEDDANQMIYTGGLQIYTTMNSRMQKAAESEFANKANFPGITNIKKDRSGNIISEDGKVILFNYDTYFDKNGNFTFNENEWKENSDGSITILKGHRVNIYTTNVNGKTDYNVEFKNLYTMEGNILYSIGGGNISIPGKFKSRDAQGNLHISKKLFKESPEIIQKSGDNLIVSSDNYSLRQKVVQPQGAMVITDPFNGSIKAMVGGRNTVGRLLYNRATSPRQPGSSIKPIAVYGPALQASVDSANAGNVMHFKDNTGVASIMGEHFTLATVLDDTPLTVQGKQWPKNWYAGFRGLYTFRGAIEQSANVPAVRVFQQLGVSKSVSFLKKLHISTIVESGSSNDLNAAALALGGMTHGISPMEMSLAYSAFVNDGKYSEGVTFTKITNRKGEVIIKREPETKQVMDSGVAFLMRDALRTTVTHGVASSASVPNQPAAGKTGTTNDNYDTWFVGFTPQYAAAVWIGNDVNLELSQGSLAAARLWGKVMTKVCSPIKTGKYHDMPSNVISVTVDSKSGKLPSNLSSMDPRGTVHSEYFVKGTEPKTTDNIHQAVKICSESGFLATPLCTATRSIVGTRRPYTPYMGVGDIGYEVPHFYCPIHNPNPSQYPVYSGASIYTFTGGAQVPEEDPGDQDQEDENTGENHPADNPATNTTPDSNGNNGGGNTKPPQHTKPTVPTQPAPAQPSQPAPPDWL